MVGANNLEEEKKEKKSKKDKGEKELLVKVASNASMSTSIPSKRVAPVLQLEWPLATAPGNS